jgi:hypothetical protein
MQYSANELLYEHKKTLDIANRYIVPIANALATDLEEALTWMLITSGKTKHVGHGCFRYQDEFLKVCYRRNKSERLVEIYSRYNCASPDISRVNYNSHTSSWPINIKLNDNDWLGRGLKFGVTFKTPHILFFTGPGKKHKPSLDLLEDWKEVLNHINDLRRAK